MLKAVAFDMDGTLLDINLGAFIAVIGKDEALLLSRAARRNPLAVLAALSGTMLALNAAGRADGLTNRQLFDAEFERRTGIPLADPVVADMIECYERQVLPTRNDAVIAAKPAAGARAAVGAALDRGLRVALLTNPTVSRAAIECRMGWGQLTDLPFELVTCMENSSFCKPDARYYAEALARLGLAPEEVLMVGNDPKRDFPVPDCGLQTAFVGGRAPVRATWSGPMAAFAERFDEIAERFEERAARGLAEIVQDTRR